MNPIEKLQTVLKEMERNITVSLKLMPFSNLLALEMKRLIQENAGRYKRTQKLPSANNTTSPKNNRTYGNTTEVITGSRKPYQVQYRVVEASDLNTSHEIDNGGVFANKNYPSELQPRNRERANMQAQVISMSNNLNPADLMDARDVNQGAPVVRNDGVVLNGNGRTAAIRYAYKNGKGDAYRNSLIQNAEKFGLSADEISQMNQPVLVRELAGDLTSEDLQDITTTQTGGARMGASQQAQSDARKLSADTLAIFP